MIRRVPNRGRAILQWLRLVAPPLWAVALLLVFLCAFETICLVAASFNGNWDQAIRLHAMRDALLAVAAGAYGLYRAWQSHPQFQKSYREFLARTPWERKRPLPLAPIHLVPQDALFIGLLLVPMLFRPMLSPAAILLAFLFSYLVLLGLALAATDQRWFSWITVFGLGLSVRLWWWNPWAALAAVAFTYSLAWQGVWRSLANFPWQDTLDNRRKELNRRLLEFQPSVDRSHCATETHTMGEMTQLWPWTVLTFHRPKRLVHHTDAWAWALQGGWWTYAVLSVASLAPISNDQAFLAELHSLSILWVAFVSGGCSIVRFFIYVGSHQSPLTLWGRIRTGRIVIPSYDVFAVTPLVVLTLGIVTYPMLALLDCPPAIGVGVVTAVILGVAMTGGPRLRHWQLTAPARLMPLTPLMQTKRSIEMI